jgi:hypothetical protein
VGWSAAAPTAVTVMLVAVSTSTLVTLAYEGFDSLDADAEHYRDGFASGWPAVVGCTPATRSCVATTREVASDARDHR